MFTELRYTLARYRWQILGWGLGIGALGLLLVSFYDSFVAEQSDFLEMIKAYPPEFLAFFGGDETTILSPNGYLGMYGFSMLPAIIGIFAVLAGSGLLASDEESGRLDLILAHPLTRPALFLGRVLALLLVTLAISGLGWLGFSALLGGSTLDVSWGQMALAFITLAVQAVVYSSFALLLSLLLPSRRLAATVAGLVMVSSYLLSSMSGIIGALEPIARVLPYAYYQGSDAINGLNWGWLLGLLVVSGLFLLLSWWRFQNRDIRVAGEGSWWRPALLSRG